MASYKITQHLSEDEKVESIPFASSRKFFAIDASGSTGGTPMRSEQAFVEAFRRTNSDSVTRWGSVCYDPTSDWTRFSWVSDCGGTEMSTILQNERALGAIHASDVWFLLTDGEVWDVNAFASLAMEKEVFGCPVVFMITSRLTDKPGDVNISVGITSYANCEDAVCLFKDYRQGRIYVFAASGCFQGLDQGKSDWENWNDLTSFDTEAELIARITELHINVRPAHTRKGLPSGVSLGAQWDAAHEQPTLVDLQLLLRAGALSDEELSSVLDEEAFDILTLAYKTRGGLADFRTWLLSQKVDQVSVQLEDVAGASALIAMLGKSDLSADKKAEFQAELRAAHVRNRDHYLNTLADLEHKAAPARKRNRLVDAAFRQLADIEKAGYSANILNRRSNRARRAADISADSAVEVSTLDFNALSYKGHCLVCCGDDEIMSVALRVLDAEAAAANTNDFALDFPLAAGRFPANINVLSSQNVCFQCASFGNPGRSIYNEDVAAILPILEYTGGNKLYINQQLYKSLTGGLKIGVSIVAQLFATILNQTLETKEWAGAAPKGVELDTETSRRKEGLEFMLHSVLANLRCRETFNEQGEYTTYPKALKWAMENFESEGLLSWMIGYPMAGFSQLLRFGTILGTFPAARIQNMKATKLIHSLTSAYLVKVLANQGQSRDWARTLLGMVYTDFNANLVPRNLGPEDTTITDVDTFWTKLQGFYSVTGWTDPDLFDGWLEDDKAAIMPKLQVLIFKLVYFQIAHTTAKNYFTTLIANEPLAGAILDPTKDLPASVAKQILLSLFLEPTAFLNAQVAAKHQGGIIPFKTPFGASVLKCGHPDCNVSFLPPNAQLDESTIPSSQLLDSIRQARAKHLIEVYGTAENFKTNETGLPEPTIMPRPPTSTHVALHISIARAWAELSIEERRTIIEGDVDGFVEKAVKKICETGRGNVFQDGLAQDVRELLPSFWEALLDTLVLEGENTEDIAVAELVFEKNKMEFKVMYEVRLDKLREGRR